MRTLEDSQNKQEIIDQANKKNYQYNYEKNFNGIGIHKPQGEFKIRPGRPHIMPGATLKNTLSNGYAPPRTTDNHAIYNEISSPKLNMESTKNDIDMSGVQPRITRTTTPYKSSTKFHLGERLNKDQMNFKDINTFKKVEILPNEMEQDRANVGMTYSNMENGKGKITVLIKIKYNK